jgi:hypothetical protein
MKTIFRGSQATRPYIKIRDHKRHKRKGKIRNRARATQVKAKKDITYGTPGRNFFH